MPVTVDLDRCDGNGECVKACAFAAIDVRGARAVVFENCTDCGACVLACGPRAIWSELFSAADSAGILAIDYSADSGIASIVSREARAAEASAVWMTVDPADAGKAADAIAAAVSGGGYSLIALPHRGSGPAIAARLSQRIRANLLSRCRDLRIDDDGGIRAARPRYGGIVKVPARCGPGITVATLLPRAQSRVVAEATQMEPPERTRAGDRIAPPLTLAARIAAIGPRLSADARRAAQACADALGASTVDPADATGKQLSPDLYVAFGIEGSTEHNAAFRNSRIVVAVVADANAPIVQIADYVLVGDVEEHARALLSAL